ncbi:MAG: hypothetical protein KDK01_07065 [Rhodobacteraceae bacterium]|jgi:hypothetical protein|nr:hypothetical protein [Paracoccaceae bacterium]
MTESAMVHAPTKGARQAVAALVIAGTSLVSAAAMACPDWQLTGQQLNYSADQLWTPQTLSVVAGGADNLRNCPQPGVGYVATRPDFDLTFTQNGAARDLEFRVNASCDTVLLVNDARGQWHFDDDGGDGLNARLRLTNAPEGAYDIWVGTYGSSTCQATLTLETFGGTPGGVVAPPQQTGSVPGCPDPALGAQTMSYRTADLARPQSFGVTAGGAMQIGGCPPGIGRGYADARPNLTLDILDSARGAVLDLRVDGTCDAVLLVNDPQGRWSFNDDFDGSINPHLALEGMTAGHYDIWVGTYNPTPCAATLQAAVSGAALAPTPAPSQPPVFSGSSAVGDTVFGFANGTEGWAISSGTLSAGPGGPLHVVTPGDGRTGYLVAPPSVTGDWRGVRAVEVVIRSDQGRFYGAFDEDAIGDIVLFNGSMTAAVEFPQQVGSGWARMSVPVEESRLWHLGGGASRVSDVLSNVTAMWVRGEYVIGDTRAEIAEIAIRGAIRQAAMPATPTQPGGEQGVMALPSSGNLQEFRDRVGQTLRFQVTGAAEGRVWGAGIYTDDSSVARAAVHAGLLRVGQTGVVQVMILPGQSSYEASSLNGVQTAQYGDWGGSYRFVVTPAGSTTFAPAPRFELVVVPEGITFDAARRRAESMGGHLATVASADELQALFAVANNPAGWSLEQGRYFIGPWLGGYRQGSQWMWITGEPWGFTAWAPGQPDNYQGRETHVNMWVRGTSPAPLLNDADPNVPLRGFVVEYPAGGQGLGTAQPSAPQAQDGFFAEAWYNGERVDGCLHYGRDCGQDAADRFCQVMGYIYAVDGAYSHVMTSRTLVLGDNRICTIPNGCGHLINVTCVPSPEALGEAPVVGQPQGAMGK